MTEKSYFPRLAEFRLSFLLAVFALAFFACSNSDDLLDDQLGTTLEKGGHGTGHGILPKRITFDDVKYWVGDKDGDCQSMLVVQWNDGLKPDGLVWGYKWYCGEEPSGTQMIQAVAQEDPRFYALLYATGGVDSSGAALGTAVGGLGYDLNENCKIKLILERSALNPAYRDTIIKPDSNGVFWAKAIPPFGNPAVLPDTADTTVYMSFDYYTKFDKKDHWQSGWIINGYWSYWIANTLSDPWTLADVGASTQLLTNGGVNAWWFDDSEATWNCWNPGVTCDGRKAPWFGKLHPVSEPSHGCSHD